MKYNRLTYFLLTGILAAGCIKQSDDTPAEQQYVTIQASLDADATKTYLDGVQVKWKADDEIALWFGTLGTSMDDEEYKLLSGEGTTSATFRGYAPARDCYMGVYPYSASDGCSKKGKLTVTLPTVQTATAGSFGPGANVAVAYSATTDLTFKNIGGLLAVHLTDVGTHNVTTMRLTGTSALSGQVDINQATLPAIDAILEGKTYVDLVGTLAAGNTYYFVVLPGSHTGFSISLYDDNRQMAQATSSHEFTIERNGNTLIADLAVPDASWGVIPSDEKVILNEVDCNAKSIELYNYGTTDELLEDWALYKDDGVEPIWTGITETIPAGGYLVLTQGASGPGVFTGGISGKKNLKLELKNASATSKDIFMRGEEGTGWGDIKTLPGNTKNSFSRVPNGNEGEWMYAAPTIGAVNGKQTGVIEQYPLVQDVVVLNELNGNDKFIELRNVSGASYSLEGVTLHKDGKLVWTGVADLSVATDGYVLLYSTDVTKTGGAHEGYDARLTFSSGLSASKAVNVQLFNAAGAPLDIFNYATYSGTPAPASYGRNADGVWYYQDATPGAVNTDGTNLVTGLE